MLKRWNFLKTGFYEGIIIAFSPPPGASDEEAAEGASRVGQIGGGIAHLGEITQRMGQLDEAFSSLRQNLFPTQAVPTGQTA